MWRYDPSANAPYTCKIYTECNTMEPFVDGHGGFIWRKPPSISGKYFVLLECMLCTHTF